MIKWFFAACATLVLLTSLAEAQQPSPRAFEECRDIAPFGFPHIQLDSAQPICRLGFALLHDNWAKIPRWTVYTLTPERALGCAKRSDSFSADQSLPRAHRAELSDYARSGYDTGHMVNSADMLWSARAERESFILSNMSPQLPALNRSAWKTLETAIRGWTLQTGDTYTIYSGNIYTMPAEKTIGRNQVVVPTALWKVVVSHRTHDAWAFLFPNRPRISNRLSDFQTTVEVVEQESGVVLPMPGSKTQVPPLLPTRSNSEARQAACAAPAR
jgi:endonuclease G, mitochondrial